MIASDADIRRRRLSNQRLVGAPFAKPEQVVQWLCAVQAQDYGGAKWAIAQRTSQATDADLDRLFDSGAILRTHVMRPTWHFVLPADIRWLLAATSPRVHAANAHYYRKVGLDDASFTRCNELLEKALAGGKHLVREELAAALAAGGVACEGLRFTFVMIHAELDAVVCSGARRGKRFTYALLDERVPPSAKLTREDALAELTRRYFASHGPATASDCAWWSGLAVSDVTAGIEAAKPRLERATVGGRTFWFSARRSKSENAGGPVAQLLPNYDEYVVAYKDRSAFLDRKIAKKLDPRTGVFAANPLLVDGRLVGSWRRALGKSEVAVARKLLCSVDSAAKKALGSATERYARFLGLALATRSL